MTKTADTLANTEEYKTEFLVWGFSVYLDVSYLRIFNIIYKEKNKALENALENIEKNIPRTSPRAPS